MQREPVRDPELEALRKICDPLADDVIAEIDRASSWQSGRPPKDLLTACRELASRGAPGCKAYLEETRAFASTIDDSEFEAGRCMFMRNGLLTLLVGFTVLVDSYAGGVDNKVLVMSGRLSGRGAFRRLVETGRFAVDVVETRGLAPDADGFNAILRVRLLHARVRAACRAHGYDVAALDEPVNQEAMCGTLMLFSCGVIMALEKLGVRVTSEERESYHRLWRAAGRLLGVLPAWLPETYAEERAIYDRLKRHAYIPNDDTTKLFEAAVRGVPEGAREHLPLWITLCGGALLKSEAFMRKFTAFCVDPLLAEHLGLELVGGWRMGFSMSRVLFRAISEVELRVGVADAVAIHAQRRLVHAITRRLLAGERARYDDPGFRAAAYA